MIKENNENWFGKILLSSLFLTVVGAVVYFWGMVYWQSFAESLGLSIGLFEISPEMVMYGAWAQVLTIGAGLLFFAAVWWGLYLLLPLLALPFIWCGLFLRRQFSKWKMPRLSSFWQRYLAKSEKHYMEAGDRSLLVLSALFTLVVAIVLGATFAAEAGQRDGKKRLDGNSDSVTRVYFGDPEQFYEGRLVATFGGRVVLRVAGEENEVDSEEVRLLVLDLKSCGRIELRVAMQKGKPSKPKSPNECEPCGQTS